ncbi:MAG: hypothetical protein JWP97_6256 [Labilithrix sp.]|nr:hypothetical protein [Labilithrix sp.]
MKKLLSAAAAAGLVAACGAPPGTGEEAAQEDLSRTQTAELHACAEGDLHTNALGDKVVLCTRLFDDGTPLHLPADDLGSSTVTFYAAVTLPTTAGGAFHVWTRGGAGYVPVDARGAVLPFDGGKGLPAGLHAPTNRVTFTIYQLKGKLAGDVEEADGSSARGIVLTSARPAVELSGCVLDRHLLGTWEGSASQKLLTPTGQTPFGKDFDPAVRVPLHVTFSKLVKGNPLSDYAGGETMADAATYVLKGTIDNFDADLTAGGKTYPSLSALGKKNPFAGARSGSIELLRLGNMHGLRNDGHWVLTYPAGSQSLTINGMSNVLVAFTAAQIFVSTPASAGDGGSQSSRADLARLEIFPHIPYSGNGHTVDLHPLAVGASTARCPQ